jgi:hypothetical protein
MQEDVPSCSPTPAVVKLEDDFLYLKVASFVEDLIVTRQALPSAPTTTCSTIPSARCWMPAWPICSR